MSEQPSAPPGGGGKILGLRPRTALIAGGVILVGAVAYFWWRRKKSASSSASSATASTSSSSSAYNQALQAELEELLSERAQSASASTSTGSGGSGTGTGTGSGGSGTTGIGGIASPVPGSSTQKKTGTGTGTTTAAKPKPAMPSGVHETKVTASSVTIAWDKTPNATSYRVRVTYQDKLVGSPHIVTGTSATVSGLGADRTYTFHVAATGPGGTSAETNGPAVKTSRS